MTTVTFKSAEIATGASTTVATTATDIVIVGSVADSTPTMPAQQSTVNFYNEANPTWTRALRVSNAAVSVVRAGASAVAWATELLVRSSLLLEQTLTWETYFSLNPVATVGVAPCVVSFVAHAVSELVPLTFVWQISDNGTFANGHRTDLATDTVYKISTDGSGSTSTLLIIVTDDSLSGNSYRCVVADSADTPNIVESDGALLTLTETPA